MVKKIGSIRRNGIIKVDDEVVRIGKIVGLRFVAFIIGSPEKEVDKK